VTRQIACPGIVRLRGRHGRDAAEHRQARVRLKHPHLARAPHSPATSRLARGSSQGILGVLRERAEEQDRPLLARRARRARPSRTASPSCAAERGQRACRSLAAPCVRPPPWYPRARQRRSPRSPPVILPLRAWSREEPHRPHEANASADVSQLAPPPRSPKSAGQRKTNNRENHSPGGAGMGLTRFALRAAPSPWPRNCSVRRRRPASGGASHMASSRRPSRRYFPRSSTCR